MIKKRSSSQADSLWESFSRTGKIGAYLTYRAVKQYEGGKQDNGQA